MEEEKAEATKWYNNPFLNIIKIVALTLLVCLVFPAIVNLLHVCAVWFNWVAWDLRNLFIVFVCVNALIVLIYVSYKITTQKEKKQDLYDQYYAAVPTVVRTPSQNYYVDVSTAVRTLPECNQYRVTEVEDYEYNHSSYRDTTAPAFQAVKESNCYDQLVMEVNSKSYRRTKVEYRRTESEKVMKTASWRSQSMDGLSSEEFRTTVETFITEKKKTLLQEIGVVDHWQNGVPQWQNGTAVNHWPNGVPQCQNGAVNRRLNGVPQQQNGGRHRRSHRSRSRKLLGGSGSTGSGSYLTISN